MSSTNAHQFALILEDDIHFAFDIDFDGLTKSIPYEFGFLQMIVSQEKLVNSLFTLRKDSAMHYVHHFASHWCAGAYLVNKSLFRAKLEPLLALFRQPGEVFSMDLIAGSNNDPATLLIRTTPPSCTNKRGNFHRVFPCVMSKSVGADHYIFSLLKSFTLTMPLFKGNSLAMQSSFDQAHVKAYERGLRRNLELIAEIYHGKHIALPPYIRLLPKP